MSEMRIMNSGGDDRVEWDTQDVATVEAAKARFAEELLTGKLAYADGERVTEFSEFAQKIVVTPRLAGG